MNPRIQHHSRGSAPAVPARHGGTEGVLPHQASPGVTSLEDRRPVVRDGDACAKSAVTRELTRSLQPGGTHGRRPPTVAIPEPVTPIQHPQWRANHARYFVPTTQNRSERIAHATRLRGSDVEHSPHLETDEWRDNSYGGLPVRTEGPCLSAKTKRGGPLAPVSTSRLLDAPREDDFFQTDWILGRATTGDTPHTDRKGELPGDRD